VPHVGGAAAIERWLRPVTFQSVPDELLPPRYKKIIPRNTARVDEYCSTRTEVGSRGLEALAGNQVSSTEHEYRSCHRTANSFAEGMMGATMKTSVNGFVADSHW